MSTIRSFWISRLGKGSMTTTVVPSDSSIVRQARSNLPLITMPQDPQTASRQLYRKASEQSSSLRMSISASRMDFFSLVS